MNLIKSTSTFSVFILLSRVLGYVRDFFIAIYLGSGLLADAFFVAFRIPNTFRRLFSEGTFNAAFVPSYASEMVKGKKQSNKFANNIFNLLFLSLLIILNNLKKMPLQKLFYFWHCLNYQLWSKYLCVNLYQKKPLLLETCHAFNPKSEVVKRLWPKWYEN